MGYRVRRGMLVAALGTGAVLLAGCSRSGLYAPIYEMAPSEDAASDTSAGDDEIAEGSTTEDATLDAPPDAAPDASRDAPTEAAPDVATPGPAGCADGTREGFVDRVKYADIAGCSGGWSIPGVMLQNPGYAPDCPTLPTYDTTTPACRRRGGNDGANPDGAGCNVADLCEAGWHVCTGARDVAARTGGNGCADATDPSSPGLFFVTRMSSNGCGDCATGTLTTPQCDGKSCTSGCAQTAALSNDVFGCGNLGDDVGLVGCDPIDRFSNNLGSALGGTNWSLFDDGSGYCESYAVVHRGPAYGGALCCRD